MKYLDIMKTAFVDTFTLSGALVFFIACVHTFILKDNSAWKINMYPFYLFGCFIGLVFSKAIGLEE